MTAEYKGLRDAVRAIIDETNLTTPEDIASKVAENVPSRQLRQALHEALVPYVRVMLHAGRGPIAGTVAPLTAPSNRSSKRNAIREYGDRWRRHLRDRVHVGGREWKMLGDCLHADVLALAQERRDNAERNLARAAQYELLADLMRRHRADQVSDLPDGVLAAFFEGEAA